MSAGGPRAQLRRVSTAHAASRRVCRDKFSARKLSWLVLIGLSLAVVDGWRDDAGRGGHRRGRLPLSRDDVSADAATHSHESVCPDKVLHDARARLSAELGEMATDPHRHAMLRASRAFVGSRTRLNALLDKLIRSEPINVLAAGGSISAGHGVAGAHLLHEKKVDLQEGLPFHDFFRCRAQAHTYHGQLVASLQRAFPPAKRQRHTRICLVKHSMDSCAFMQLMSAPLSKTPRVDLALLEFGTLDFHGNSIMEDANPLKTNNALQCIEAVVIKLRASYPGIAIVFVEFVRLSKKLHTVSAQARHALVARHHNISIVSFEDGVRPLLQSQLRQIEDFAYTLPNRSAALRGVVGCQTKAQLACRMTVKGRNLTGYFERIGNVSIHCKSVCQHLFHGPGAVGRARCAEEQRRYGSEACYIPLYNNDPDHPSFVGHSLAKDFILHLLMAHITEGCRSLADHHPPQPTTIARDDQRPPQPLTRRSYAELLALTSFVQLNSSEHKLNTPLTPPALVPSRRTSGFEERDDRSAERLHAAAPKIGWVADTPAGGEEIEFEVDVPDAARGCATIFVGALRTYSNNVGQFEASVIEAGREATARRPVVFDGLWSDPMSIVQLLQVTDAGGNTCSVKCRVRIVTRPQVRGRDGNKVKVTHLGVRPCLDGRPEDPGTALHPMSPHGMILKRHARSTSP